MCDHRPMPQESTSFLAQSRTFEIAPKSGELIEVDRFSSSMPASDMANVILDSKFQILNLLGQGGMGAVYRARHLNLDKDIALKTFKTRNTSVQAIERFNREVRAVAKLDHPNIIQVFDSGITEQNQPYYTMELLHGDALDEKLKSVGCLDVDEALAVFLQVADGLRSAHNNGIVHRDLKPANIFLAKQTGGKTVAKLVDFGIAKLADGSVSNQFATAAGTVFGSPLYMSPEQSRGLEVDKRSDIYSFGCTMYEALVGRPPHIGANAFETMILHQTATPLRISEVAPLQNFPPMLEAIVSRLLSKDPDHRPQSFDEIIITLKRLRKMTHTDNASPVSADIRRKVPFRAETPNLADQGKSTLSRISGGATTEIYDPHASSEIENARKAPLWLIPTVAFVIAAGAAGAGIWYFHSFDKVAKPASRTPDDSLKPIIEMTTKKQNNAARSVTKDADEAMMESGFKNSVAVQISPAMPYNLQRGQAVVETYDCYISPENIAELQRSHVRKLGMVRCIFNNKALGQLANVGIQTMNMGLSNLDDSGAEELSKFRVLMILNIDGTKITDKASKSLAKIQTLHTLDISRNGITDATLDTISVLPNLSDVVMHNTSVTPDGVTKLCRQCKTVKRVHLGGCRFITDDDIKKLKASFPDLNVVTQNLKYIDNDPNHLVVPDK